MLLLVGLGNPGQKYEKQRHNIGFMAVDEIVRRHNFVGERNRFQGVTWEKSIGNEKVLILKPQTYMNESGRSVGEACRFYKIEPENVIVFHDELDLAPNKLKVKLGGGIAGHNGLRSIAAHIGPDFRRVRMGIGHPGHKDRVHSYVLGDFSKADREWVDPLNAACADAIESLIDGDDAGFMTKVALILKPARNQGVKNNGNLTQSEHKEQKNKPEPVQTKSETSANRIAETALSAALRAAQKKDK